MLISFQNDQSQNQKLRLAEVLSALTYALDITEGQPEGHSVRCCWIGLLIAEELKLDDQQTWNSITRCSLKTLDAAAMRRAFASFICLTT